MTDEEQVKKTSTGVRITIPRGFPVTNPRKRRGVWESLDNGVPRFMVDVPLFGVGT